MACACCFPPHPNPLPQGEGTAAAHAACFRVVMCQDDAPSAPARPAILSRLGGEGRDEGEQDVRPSAMPCASKYLRRWIMSDYVELSNLTKTYPAPNGPAVIVQDFSLRIKKGEFVCLIGHSGCGKSTVLSMVAGLNDVTSGGIILAGKELVGPGPDRGVVFQSPCLLPWLTAFSNVMLGVNQVFYTADGEERRQIAEYYLSVVGLADAMHKKPAELSQGMRQRVGIARAFALAPKMLLLDEPFGMLDSLTRIELQQVLIELWRKDRKTALMVTHDVDEALFLADRIVMMTNGPAAKVGDILEVPFPRPRERKAVLEHPDYYRLREHLITFLEVHAHRPQPTEPSEDGGAAGTHTASESKESTLPECTGPELVGALNRVRQFLGFGFPASAGKAGPHRHPSSSSKRKCPANVMPAKAATPDLRPANACALPLHNLASTDQTEA
jgi:nitrate/nitrite transport system ATP-binding protein